MSFPVDGLENYEHIQGCQYLNNLTSPCFNDR